MYAREMPPEIKTYLDQVEEAYGKNERRKAKLNWETCNNLGFEMNMMVPKEFTVNIPKTYYQGYLLKPNRYSVGEKVILKNIHHSSFIEYGTVKEIRWRLSDAFTLDPVYRMKNEEIPYHWYTEAELIPVCG